jgi:F-type H+-transporting ATPase subunit epsilon
VTILAEEATPLSSLSKAEAQQRIVDAEAALAAAANDTPERRDAAMERVLSARAMLEAATAA